MTITYTIAIDRNDDGTLEAITSDVLRVEWQIGMVAAYRNLAPAAVARITLRNRDGAYSPQINSLQPGIFLRIISDDGSTTRTHFSGLVREVLPETGTRGAQQSVIIAQGRMAELASQQINLPVQINRTADQIIQQILDRVRFRYAVLDGFCIIDYAGQNQIDAVLIFDGEPITRSLQTGVSVFGYVGDRWQSGIRAEAALLQCALSEGGVFFFNREGHAIFYNRYHALLNDQPAAIFSDDMQGALYHYADAVLNQAEATFLPREIGLPATPLWSLGAPLRIPRDAVIELVVPFTDDNDEPIGALQVDRLRRGSDYQANSASDGTGLAMTDFVTVVLAEVNGSSAVLQIRNTANRRVWITALTVRGTPLYTRDAITLMQNDPLSQSLYGVQREQFELPLISDLDEVLAALVYQVLRRSQPRGRLHALTINTRTHPAETLALTLFDRIRVTESQTAHSADYLIVQEQHTIDRGGAHHQVTYLLEPVPTDQFFVVGQHAVDGAQVVLPR